MLENKGPQPGVETVGRYREGLIACAIAYEQENPGARVIGFVAEADAPEVTWLLSQPGAFSTGDGSVAAVVTRDSAKKWLADVSPGLLDWLPDAKGGSHRILPVVHAARHGTRTLTIEYEVSE